MEELILVLPDERYAPQIASYRQEFLFHNSPMDGCGSLRSTEDPDVFIRNCRQNAHKDTVAAHLVPEDLFLLIRSEDDRLLGMIDIRHELNDYLAMYGGHIGYSIRPSERRKGYAKKMLLLALDKCRERGVKRILITCNEGNTASERTILAGGGVFEATVANPHTGINVKRFWIEMC